MAPVTAQRSRVRRARRRPPQAWEADPMLRVLGYIIIVALIVAGAVWFAERPAT